jgi:hypothetical protein
MAIREKKIEPTLKATRYGRSPTCAVGYVPEDLGRNSNFAQV